jgi:hypothetical protein
MKLIITESKLKEFITKMIGYDLSDRIEMITNWVELSASGRKVFNDNRETFRFYLNHYGPFFKFDVGVGLYPDSRLRDTYYVQDQGKENGWFISGAGWPVKMDEYEFLKLLGIESLGIGLNTIIDQYFVEE